MIIEEKRRILLERHKDLVNTLVRCRIMIEDREDPTVLDIMTDMRALEGIVTVRQTRPSRTKCIIHSKISIRR